jgi:hypothetical protein
MRKCSSSLFRCLVRYTTTNRLRKQRWKEKRKEQVREERTNKQQKVNIKTQRYVADEQNEMKWIKRCTEKYNEKVSKNNVKIGKKGQSKQRQIKNSRHNERKIKEDTGESYYRIERNTEKRKDK